MARRTLKRRGAAADLLEHFVFIGEHSEEVALRFLHAAQETFELLATQPEMVKVTAHRNPLLVGMRVFPVKNFERYLEENLQVLSLDLDPSLLVGRQQHSLT